MSAPLLTLAQSWRTRAAELRQWADAEGAARSLEGCAADLERTVRESEAEVLTLSEAAEASGYSDRRLREMLADGSLPNAGAKGRPRIRRADLPRKARAVQGGAYDPAADARSLRVHLTPTRKAT